MIAELNWLAIVVGTIGYMLLGFAWYTLFSSTWMDAMGWSDHADMDGDSPTVGYVITTIASVVAVLSLAILVEWVGATTWQDGLMLGLLVGVGFVATTAVQAVPFEGRPWTLYGINTGYNIVALAGIGCLLALW